MKFQKRKMILIAVIILTLINLVYEFSSFLPPFEGEVLNVTSLNFAFYE